MQQSMHMAQVEEFLVPSTPELVRMYEERGGQLTRDPQFGIDPFCATADLYQSRHRIFVANTPAPEIIFSHLVHGDYDSLEHALRLFHYLTTIL